MLKRTWIVTAMLKLLRNKHYVEYALWAIGGIVALLSLFGLISIPFRFGTFLFFKGQLWEPFAFAWPLFALGIAINVYKLSTTTNPPEVHEDAAKIPLNGFLTSLMAGVMEEIVFRWVLFFGFLGLFWFVDNVILFNDLSKWVIYDAPWINTWATMGNLTYANDPKLWAIGLAFLCSNFKFQQGHIYAGVTGFLLSGLGGWYFFAIMLNYGLYAGMLVHFGFDMLVFTLLLIDVLFEMAAGNSNAHGRMYKWY